MSVVELERMEREVEQARARVAADLTRLQTPGTLSGIRQGLTSEMASAKDELVERTKDAALDGMQNVLSEIKGRVAANPVAALAIGAGLAWRLTRHPPIASALLGFGLISLFRTDPKEPGVGAEIVDRAAAAAGTARRQIEELHPGETAGRIAEAAGAAKDSVVGWGADAGAAARDAAARAGRNVEAWSDSGRDMVSRAMHHEDRDKYLLGAAALAVAAAVGIAYQRRASDESDD